MSVILKKKSGETMNFQLLNKKWSSFYNWTVLYPSLFILLIILGAGYWVFSSFANFNLEHSSEYLFGGLIGVYFGFILLAFLFIPYTIWFIVASDSIAKLLGWNRILFNVLNILAIFSFLYFITIIFLWIKVKDVFEDNGYPTTWSGKLK